MLYTVELTPEEVAEIRRWHHYAQKYGLLGATVYNILRKLPPKA